MKTTASEFVSPRDIELFEQIKRSVDRLTEVDLGFDEMGKEIVLSCHMLGRAVGRVYGVPYVDGHFAGFFEHTWLLASSAVIDVYPVGIIGGPILVDNSSFLSPARMLYKAVGTRKLSRGRFGGNLFRRSVDRIARAIER